MCFTFFNDAIFKSLEIYFHRISKALISFFSLHNIQKHLQLDLSFIAHSYKQQVLIATLHYTLCATLLNTMLIEAHKPFYQVYI